MDFQIWLVPVLSLIGGAAGAAIINGWFGIKKLKADRHDEHYRWLRDKRQEAYVEFFEATRLVLSLAAEADTDERRATLSDKGNEIKGSPIRLLAPEPILTLVEEVHEDVQAFVLAATDSDLPSETREEGMAAIRPGIVSKRQQLAELCREDLRTPRAGKPGVGHP